MNTVEAIYEKGVFRPVQKVDLEEGEKVEIIIKIAVEKDPAADFSDIAQETGITDLAVNIDHYLYGLPKQSEE
jgi:predicted DNA-binding antitoxin AbrB/MazE fold protein